VAGAVLRWDDFAVAIASMRGRGKKSSRWQGSKLLRKFCVKFENASVLVRKFCEENFVLV